MVNRKGVSGPEAVKVALVYAANRDQWWTAYDIQRAVYEFFGRTYSESAVTARIRDLRKAVYGGHRIECRRRAGSTAHEYRLVPPVSAGQSVDLFRGG